MKILHVTPSYLPAIRYGGPIWSVHGLAKAQAALGHDVHVYTTNIDGPGDSDVPVGKIVNMDGVKVTYFQSPKLRRLVWAPKMAKALKSAILDFDIVHTHSVYLWPTTAAARIARRAGVPYVVAPRGMLWKSVIEERSKWIKTAWIAAFEKKNIERATAIHVTADLEAEKISEIGLKISQIIKQPNAVNAPNAFDMKDVSVDVVRAIACGDYFLSLGRLSWKKNNIALIRALKEVPNLRLIIAGNEEDGHALELSNEIKKLGLDTRITLIARQVSGADKEALFAKSQAFVLPSLSENMGNTVLEAMARKTPVIVSRHAGVMEIVQLHDCGYICDPTPNDLARALKALIGNPVTARQMAERGENAARNIYNWPQIAHAMCEAYAAAVSPKKVNP